MDPLPHQPRLAWRAKVMGEVLRFPPSLAARLPERRPPGERSGAADDGSALLCSNIQPTVTRDGSTRAMFACHSCFVCRRIGVAQHETLICEPALKSASEASCSTKLSLPARSPARQ